ncbi:Eco47II family restriction endonuclease [Flavobacterium sp. RHBU_24]|uniref:Eco47II family restriction endonuclease n=1 Tax=Flavobacterium sp. RHBU_24 TaxID=3391185 RepID=UPI003984B53A
MPYLKWISDERLIESVNHLLLKASLAKTNTNIHKNVIDPFSAIFEIAGFELDYEVWLKGEISRQAQKTLQNHIGDFHQNILGFSEKWVNKKTGSVVDLVSDELKIIAEIKNKYNTISGGKLADLYNSLNSLIMPKASIYKDYTAYYVVIIPKKAKRYNVLFVPSNKEQGEKCPPNEKIREMDGSSFYALVTGHENALEELFDILPQVIIDISSGKYRVEDKEKLKLFFNQAFG